MIHSEFMESLSFASYGRVHGPMEWFQIYSFYINFKYSNNLMPNVFMYVITQFSDFSTRCLYNSAYAYPQYHRHQFIMTQWRHMVTEIWVNTGSGNGWVPSGIYIDFILVRVCGIYLRAVSQWMPMLPFCIRGFKIGSNRGQWVDASIKTILHSISDVLSFYLFFSPNCFLSEFISFQISFQMLYILSTTLRIVQDVKIQLSDTVSYLIVEHKVRRKCVNSAWYFEDQ